MSTDCSEIQARWLNSYDSNMSIDCSEIQARWLNSDDSNVSIDCSEILELSATGEPAWHGKQHQLMSAPALTASQ